MEGNLSENEVSPFDVMPGSTHGCYRSTFVSAGFP